MLRALRRFFEDLFEGDPRAAARGTLKVWRVAKLRERWRM
jgi:hypothetical protein